MNHFLVSVLLILGFTSHVFANGDHFCNERDPGALFPDYELTMGEECLVKNAVGGSCWLSQGKAISILQSRDYNGLHYPVMHAVNGGTSKGGCLTISESGGSARFYWTVEVK